MHAPRHVWLLAALCLAGTVLAGCHNRDQEGGDQAVGTAPQAPTGPVPGPGTSPERYAGPYDSDPVALQEGRKLFVQYNCSGCHGGRAGGGMGPSLRDQDWIYGHGAGDIFDSITQGRAHGMPAWGTRITDDQAWKLVAYIHSLRTPAEPDPPEEH
ncbi:MAG TPA: c-type cytochrome [Frateuria sp.]|uniref:c-type cytochrome n=1 Tax=Frateuria sp. TaxID=2211372 RepID=UPI002D7F125D|nr:c-type cytochrome [Frateuria sp.]HET6805117.1 c-type cytochrome [Frateuria sp.]